MASFRPPYAVRYEVGVLMVHLVHERENVVDEHDGVIISIKDPLVIVHTYYI